MLDAIQRFVNRTILREAPAPDPRTPAPSGVQVAACALLLELAHADGEFSEAERLHIESAVGRGTKVTMVLPAQKVEAVRQPGADVEAAHGS